ncbi:MAG TPA: acetyl-CoA hydrolase/transferase C-terminal domain-containing protein [Syntrophomonadaceae bacterium]|nr:acetyl-CoA hydrolase/transferase C-terminal domain-containing protein [Syntrophomonadaceae bacterium]HPR92438.1 acetyl-CoA hydrolase/transferase C-terminal domain-containing protein [Syntrophomonadaceae bacterium]
MEKKWQEIYKSKLKTAEEAVTLIGSGELIASASINGQPPQLVDALARRMASGEIKDVRFIFSLSVRMSSLYNPEIIAQCNQNNNSLDAMYAGPLERYFLEQGGFTYIPHRLADGPLMTARVGLDAALITVSPMDKHGFFSTGINPEYIYGFIRRNPGIKILAEVNSYMPRTHGNNHFHISELAAVVENDLPLFELPDIPLTEQDELIGQYIAERVPDGACLQLGIGGIPNAVGKYLINKKDLGIHSEMLCDTMVDLYEAGVITGTKKKLLPRRWVACFAMGSKRLYDFLADNPMIEMHDSEWVNDPYVIAMNDNVVSINATLEVDLSGQCASEAIGTRQYSGAGGQMDFTEGAWRSNGGLAFLACYSTYKDKSGVMHSSIVPTLRPGSMVTTTRNDVQYVVTEYGVARLKGFNLRQRVNDLVRIAHPDFRDWLMEEAMKLNYIK